MKIRLISILLLALLLAHSKHAIAGIAITTISVGATVVASCTLPKSGQPATGITTSCTAQTAVRIGEVSTADANQSLAVDTDQPLTRSSERINPTTQIKEITIER
jgi:hypothetical protein